MHENPQMSVADATEAAMAEITAPIIAVSLVLLSVFVPTAFIPGITGTMFQQSDYLGPEPRADRGAA